MGFKYEDINIAEELDNDGIEDITAQVLASSSDKPYCIDTDPPSSYNGPYGNPKKYGCTKFWKQSLGKYVTYDCDRCYGGEKVIQTWCRNDISLAAINSCKVILGKGWVCRQGKCIDSDPRY